MSRATRIEIAAAAICVLILLRVSSARGQTPPGPPEPAGIADGTAEIRINGSGASVDRTREVIDELLARAHVSVVWPSAGPFRPEQIFELPAAEQRPPAAGTVVARIWIDLTAERQARLYLGDATAERFVIRRLPLAHGLDEIGREEIGHIVVAAVRALIAGAEGTLSRTEARVALAEPVRPVAVGPSPVSKTAPDGSGGGVQVELGAIAAVQLFAHQPATVPWFGIAAALLWPYGAAPSHALFGVWTELSAGLPASYGDNQAIALDIGSQSLRGGLSFEWVEAGTGGPARWRARASLGGGVDGVTFSPRRVQPNGAPADEGIFWAPAARIDVSVARRVWRDLWIALGTPCDVELADVHYDIIDETGVTRTYLAPYRVRLALSLGVIGRF